MRLQDEEKKDHCEGDYEVEEANVDENDEDYGKRGKGGGAKKKQKTTPKDEELKEEVVVPSSSSEPIEPAPVPLGSVDDDNESCAPSSGGRVLLKRQESFATAIISSYPPDETLEKTPIPQLQRALDATVALADKLLNLINKKTEAGGDYDLSF